MTDRFFSEMFHIGTALDKQKKCHNPTRTCMVNLPDSNMIHIVHSLGFGTNPIGQVSPIATHLLTLTGDGSAVNPPQALILPQEITRPLEI